MVTKDDATIIYLYSICWDVILIERQKLLKYSFSFIYLIYEFSFNKIYYLFINLIKYIINTYNFFYFIFNIKYNYINNKIKIRIQKHSYICVSPSIY